MEVLFQQMDDWYQKVPGQLLLKAEKRAANYWLEQWGGEILLQIGGPNQALLYDTCTIDCRIRLSPESVPRYHGPSVQSHWSALPFLPNTMDVVLLPHVLEYCDYPQELINQAYRVLVAGGHVLILSFNTYSFWGLRKSLSSTRAFPWRGSYWGAFRIRHWLNHSGFDVVAQKTLFFRPSWQSTHGQKVLSFMEPIGQLIWPYFGAVNLLVAKKSAISVTPLKKQRKNKQHVRVGSSSWEPTTRNY